MSIHNLIKALLLALLGMTFTTVVAQAPIFPFPSQAPVAELSAQPFLQPNIQPNQVVVGKASVAQIAPTQRSYAAPTLTTTPTVIGPPVTGPLQIVISEHELLNMDLKREMAYQTRIQRQVQTTRDINSFSSMMVQNLSRSGWSTSWQGVRNSTGAVLTDLYQSGLYAGGEHLRLEVTHGDNGGYQVLLYKF